MITRSDAHSGHFTRSPSSQVAPASDTNELPNSDLSRGAEDYPIQGGPGSTSSTLRSSGFPGPSDSKPYW